MFKFILMMTTWLVCFSHEGFAVTEDEYMVRAICQIEEDVKESESFNEKALNYQNLEKWFQLLAKMNISKKEKTLILKKTKKNIDFLTKEFRVFPKHFFSDETNETIPVIYEGKSTEAFVNLGQEYFEEELKSYQKNKSFEKIEIISGGLEKLRIETHYNYILSLDGKVFCSELQEYDELFTKKHGKVLLAPNHAILADGQPVIAAGELKIIGSHDFPIYWIAATSGHYHPNLASKKHIESKLIEFGVPKEQIITLGFHFHKLPWKIVEESLEKTAK